MYQQMKTLARLGLLGNFIGMLTDSRQLPELYPPRAVPPPDVQPDRQLGREQPVPQR